MNPFGSTRRISGDLKAYLKRSNLTGLLVEKDILFQWEKVVGTALSAQIELVDVQEGVLLLRASSASWKSEIMLQKSMVLRRANEVMGTRQFKDLRFIT